MLNILTISLILAAHLFVCQVSLAQETAAREKRQISLELEEVEGASAYEIELISKKTNKPLSFKMTKPLWKASIRPGEYSLRLRSYDARGVPGNWSEATEFLVRLPSPLLLQPVADSAIKTNEDENFSVAFAWQEIPGAKKYRLDVLQVGGTQKWSETFTEPKGEVKLPVAKPYTWTVTAISQNKEDGETQEKPQPFTLIGRKLEPPKIEKPEDIWVNQLNWKTVDHASHYTCLLQHKDEKAWAQMDLRKDYQLNSLSLPISYPGGKYRLTVQAEAALREPSDPAKIEFPLFEGDRSPAAVEESKLRYSLEKPTPWYFLASYLVTQVQYTALNSEAGSGRIIDYDAVGGTGRLGLGYTDAKKNRGYLGVVDLSGFTVAGKNVTYASAEAHSTMRYTWGRNLVRPSAGLFYKELIESHNTIINLKKFEQRKLSYLGPHIGFDFWRPFTSKLGFQFNTRIYSSLFTAQTPSDSDIEPEISYQFGFMGSYKIKPHITGFLGWAHRLDKATYASTVGTGDPSVSVAPIGSKQTIQIEGDYLNLLLEWGF